MPRGRPPIPTAIHRLRGTSRKDRHGDRLDAVVRHPQPDAEKLYALIGGTIDRYLKKFPSVGSAESRVLVSGVLERMVGEVADVYGGKK